MRERGLKYHITLAFHHIRRVAPHAGAWIEICNNGYIARRYRRVAPHAGAWIEIGIPDVMLLRIVVAPHAGAWIEILPRHGVPGEEAGRSPCGSVD